MPAAWHRAASDSRIGREALARSVSFLQKRSKPPPVPETPTTTLALRYARSKLSAPACANGATVLEPSDWTVPLIACAPATAAATDASATAAVPPPTSRSLRILLMLTVPFRFRTGRCQSSAPRRAHG